MSFPGSRRFLATAVAAALLVSARPGAATPLKEQRHLFELGVYLGAYFPPKMHELYDWERGTHQPLRTVAVDVGLRIGYLPLPYLGAELEMGFMPTATRAGDGALVYTIRAHVIGQLALGRWAPFLVVGGGGLMVYSDLRESLGSDTDGAFHWGLGVKYYAASWFALRLDVRHIVSHRYTTDGFSSHVEALLGATFVLNWQKPPPDTDKDGVPDATDKCPKVPAKTKDGCPPDRDGDGVIDAKDKCPDVAAKTEDGCPPDRDGDGVIDAKDKCPDVAARTADGCPLDTDGDGVIDARDKCPKVAARTADGCPIAAPDQDGDGVPDSADKCPTVAAKTADGCPPDRDGDGILDNADECPDQPETFNGFEDKDGCPDVIPIIVRKFTGAIRGIKFAYNRAKIRRRSYRTLRAAVKVLKKYAGLRLNIRGHTDNRGGKQKNLKLSKARAEAVKAYLVNNGIAASRLEVEGVGEAEPIASNNSRRGRGKNRRIEFVLLK